MLRKKVPKHLVCESTSPASGRISWNGQGNTKICMNYSPLLNSRHANPPCVRGSLCKYIPNHSLTGESNIRCRVDLCLSFVLNFKFLRLWRTLLTHVLSWLHTVSTVYTILLKSLPVVCTNVFVNTQMFLEVKSSADYIKIFGISFTMSLFWIFK